MELYSPPRVLQQIHEVQRWCWAFDILNGWNFDSVPLKELTCAILSLGVIYIFLSPPCTMFSELQRLWNYKKMPPHIFEARWSQAKAYMDHCCALALTQCQKGR